VTGAFESGDKPSDSVKEREFVDYLGEYQFPKRSLLRGVR
jgi:hypothetical protein